MKITRNVVEGLQVLTDDLTKTQEQLSEMVKTVKSYKGDVEHELKREGKMVRIKERYLWDEVYYLGKDSQAGRVLAEKYPEIFELWDLEQKIASDYNIFVKSNLHIDANQMKMSDFIQLILGLIEYKNGDGKETTYLQPDSTGEESTDEKGTESKEDSGNQES